MVRASLATCLRSHEIWLTQSSKSISLKVDLNQFRAHYSQLVSEIKSVLHKDEWEFLSLSQLQLLQSLQVKFYNYCNSAAVQAT